MSIISESSYLNINLSENKNVNARKHSECQHTKYFSGLIEQFLNLLHMNKPKVNRHFSVFLKTMPENIKMFLTITF